MRFLQPQFRINFIDVQLRIQPQLPVIVVDRWHVVQAIVNLLQNAADAMAETEPRILTIEAGVEDCQLQISVSDTGVGIPTENLSRVFDPFFTTKGDQGTGLGLFIAKHVIEEHGGTLRVRATDEGSSFTFSLPL
jgi:two-component system NtrC family sensor kinase